MESEIVKQVAGIQYAHPTILYVVRKVKISGDSANYFEDDVDHADNKMIMIMMLMIKHDNHDTDADNKT